MKKIFLAFSLIVCLILPQLSLAYDPKTTHSGITEQVVEFYNSNNNIKIGSADRELIIQGSIDEDDPALRSLNHFYDPVRGIGINDYRTAIDWVTELNNGNDFSWPASIEKYAKGDREGALIGLGHILHLAEDMTVPDHTRNDPHMAPGLQGLYTGISLYEKWAKEHKTRETLKGLAYDYVNLGYKPRANSSIENYFKNIAAYSNNNYVSPDTIDNSVYQYANPVVVEKRNGYAYGEDSYFYDKHKIYIDYKNRQGERFFGLIDSDTNDFSVLEDYFNRLGKMAILSGAGITEMFFQEAESARTEYLEAERKRQEEQANYEAEKSQNLNTGGLLSRTWYWVKYAVADTASAIAGTISNTTSAIASGIYNGSALALDTAKNSVNSLIYTGDELATIGVQKVERAVTSASKKVVLYVKENVSNLSNLVTPALAYTSPAPATPTILTNSQIVQLISALSEAENISTPIETSDNDSDEPATETVHHSGSHHDHLAVTDPVSTTTESTSTATTTGDVATTTDPIIATSTDPVATTTDDVATTTATTTDETATSTATTTDPVIDTVPPEFTFGIAQSCLNFSETEVCLLATTTVDFTFIASSTDIAFYTIDVDDGDVTATTSDSSFSLDLADGYKYQIKLSATDASGNSSEPIETSVDIYTLPVVISEVAWMGTATSSYDEWMELANKTPYDLDLSGWTLADGNDINISLSGQIDANGFYLLERTDDTTISDIAADLIYRGDLNNGGEALTLSQGGNLIDQTPSGSWPAGNNSSKASMERKNSFAPGSSPSNWVTNPDYGCNGLSADPLIYIVGTPRSLNSRDMPPMPI